MLYCGTILIDTTEGKVMKIVIIGDGKVGYKLARQLSVENYDVVMIDSNEKKLKYAVDRLDIACVIGENRQMYLMRIL